MEGLNVALIIWTYITPVIIFVGTIGNVLTLIAVTNRHSRKSSFTVYLAALAITDIAYLYSAALFDWLVHTFALHYGSFGNFVCKVTWFLRFLTSHSSSWLIAALTVERMFCMYFPLKTKAVCVPRTGYIVVGTIIGVLLFMDAHLLYAIQENDVTNNNTMSAGLTCEIVVPGYETVYATVFAWIDFGLYFLLPIFVIVIANSATVVAAHRRKTFTTALTTVNSNRMKRTRHLFIITFLVSFAFIIFVTPVVIVGVVMPDIYFFETYVLQTDDSAIHYIIWASLYTWSFVNHAVNFFLYVLSGERFHQELKEVFCKSSAEQFAD